MKWDPLRSKLRESLIKESKNKEPTRSCKLEGAEEKLVFTKPECTKRTIETLSSDEEA